MNLREEVEISAATYAIGNAIRTLENVNGRLAGYHITDIQNEYLDAIRRVTVDLRNFFVSDEFIDDFYSPRYWRIGRLADWARPLELVRDEIEEQTQRIKHALAKLEKWRQLGERPGLLAILDTNTYMHGMPVKDIDWRKELDSKEVRIVLPIHVLTELDNNKYSGEFTRKRANAALKPFSGFLKAIQKDGLVVLRNGVTLELLLDEPDHRPELNPDDEIVSRGVFLQQVTGREVTLVTLDYSAQARAYSRGLSVHELSQENRKPSGA